MRHLRGYTLVESVVAISIFTILASVVVFNLNQGRRNEDLRQGSTELVLRLREIQSMAFNGFVSGDTVPTGYGVYVAQNCLKDCQYSTFLDMDGDLQYGPSDQVLNQYRFASPLALYRVALRGVNDSIDAPHSLVFRSPSPTFSYDAIDNVELELYVRHQGTNRCRVVSVRGASGQIDEQGYQNPAESCQ